MKIFGRCFDRRVLLALGAVAVGLWAIAPDAVARFAPLLLLLACPVSMVFMMRSMGGHAAAHPPALTPQERLIALDRERAQLEGEIAAVPISSSGRPVAIEPRSE